MAKGSGFGSGGKVTRASVRSWAIAKLNERLKKAGVDASWSEFSSEQFTASVASDPKAEEAKGAVVALALALQRAERVLQQGHRPKGGGSEVDSLWIFPLQRFFGTIRQSPRGKTALEAMMSGPLVVEAMKKGPSVREKLINFWTLHGVPWNLRKRTAEERAELLELAAALDDPEDAEHEADQPAWGPPSATDLALFALATVSDVTINEGDTYEVVLEREVDAMKKARGKAKVSPNHPGEN